MGVTVAIHIPASLETVWEAVADLASHVEWMADARRIDFQTTQRAGVGTRMKVLTRIGPFTATDVIEVTGWDPLRRIAVRHEGLFTGEGEFRLDAVAGGVLFTWSEQLTFPSSLGGRVGAWMAKPVLQWLWRRNLNRLRQRLTLV